jgi:hypothetical protein
MSPVWKAIVILYGLYSILIIIGILVGNMDAHMGGQAIGGMLLYALLFGWIINIIYRWIKK